MPNPTRDTTAGQVYNDLRKLARGSGRPTDEIMVDYLLERFLFRMAESPFGGDHFILKGGLLLARFGARRMTRDIDILGRHFPGKESEILHRISAIASHRDIELRQLGPLLTGFADLRQPSYAAWRRRQGPAAGGYPERFSHVVELVTTFADPLLAGSISGRTWSPERLTWS